MKPIYRVMKHTLYEKCDEKTNYFTVEKQISFIGFKWWKSIKETQYGWGNSQDVPIRFNTESEAVYAIKKLESGNYPDGWVLEVSSILDFNKRG